MSKIYTIENTYGYTARQIAELNRLLAIEIAELTGDEDLYYELVQAASERVLAAFDPPGA